MKISNSCGILQTYRMMKDWINRIKLTISYVAQLVFAQSKSQIAVEVEFRTHHVTSMKVEDCCDKVNSRIHVRQ